MTDQLDPQIVDQLKLMVLPGDPPPNLGTDAAAGNTAESTHRYQLVPRPAPPPVPNGWYAACFSADLGPSEVRSFIAVEHELVAYRDESGVAHVVAAHCPHLGAHLGGGHVVGETIQCPYHGWRFGGDGACVDVPYSDAHIPSKACLPTYPVREQDGFVFFWFHAGGAEPTYELPRVAEVGDDGWTEPHPFQIELVAALQEMGENNVDYAHLRYVHGRAAVPNDTSTFTTDGPFSTVVEDMPTGLTFTRDAWGPGVALLRVPGVMTIYSTTTPIDRRHCGLQWHFYFPEDMASSAELIMEGVTGTHGLQADIPIWRDKIFLERPVLVKADGNIAEFRRWYAQFYEGR